MKRAWGSTAKRCGSPTGTRSSFGVDASTRRSFSLPPCRREATSSRGSRAKRLLGRARAKVSYAWARTTGVAPVSAIDGIIGDRLRRVAHATVTELYIEPMSRRGGIGTATLLFVEGLLREEGIEAFELQVERRNAEARSFYEKFGMEAHDRIPLSKRIPRA